MRNIIDSIIRVLCTAIMGIMVVAVCWQVITRYVLNNPSTVTEEALRYLLVWTTMVGAAYAYGKRKHLSINILLKKVSAPVQKIVDIGVPCHCILHRGYDNGRSQTMRYRCGPVFCGPGNSHALYLQLSAGRCGPLYLLRPYFYLGGCKGIEDIPGAMCCGMPPGKTKPLSTPGGCFKK